MRLYLIDPKLNWYKANLHCHTCNSDGHFTPEEIKKLYIEHGYQVVAYSEHDVIFDVRHLTDDNFIAITSTELSIDNYVYPANYGYVNKDNFIRRDYEHIHLNIYAKDPNNLTIPATNIENLKEHYFKMYGSRNIPCDGYKKEFTKESIQEVIDRANRAGFLVQFNHPNWSLNTRDDYINLKGLWALEVLNYATDIETGTEYCINIYDEMLREGHKICCVMGDDNHNNGGSLEGSFGGFNYIGAKELKYDQILSAMENGNIYCSTGPRFKSIYFDTKLKKIIVRCTSSENISFVGYNRTFRHHYGKNLTKAEFPINGDEIYFRISLKDKHGKVAHTRAYFLKEIGL